MVLPTMFYKKTFALQHLAERTYVEKVQMLKVDAKPDPCRCEVTRLSGIRYSDDDPAFRADQLGHLRDVAAWVGQVLKNVERRNHVEGSLCWGRLVDLKP